VKHEKHFAFNTVYARAVPKGWKVGLVVMPARVLMKGWGHYY